MPTEEQKKSISLEQARAIVRERAFKPLVSDVNQDKIGVEIEIFPIFNNVNNKHPRVPVNSLLMTLDNVSQKNDWLQTRKDSPKTFWKYPLQEGGFIMFEDGAQIEIATKVFESAAELLKHTKNIQKLLFHSLNQHNITLIGVGADIWNSPDEIGLQIHTPRQIALNEFFSKFGEAGKFMLMNTASFQISLELGDKGIQQDRWILANLISPLVLATFACSPSENGVSTRALCWQALDLTRVGFPSKFSSEISNPQEGWSEAALKANIAIFNLAPDTMESAKTELSFEDWIKNGHPLYGWPTIDDLIYHLSTLYFEVRPRGYIELRSCDMLPDIFQPVPVVLIAALFYESRALKASIDLLVDRASELTDLWKRAATFGLRDPEIANLSCQLWEIALNGVSNLSETYFGEENIQKAKDFLEKYTFRSRMPADDLEELQQISPNQAIEWASLGQDR